MNRTVGNGRVEGVAALSFSLTAMLLVCETRVGGAGVASGLHKWRRLRAVLALLPKHSHELPQRSRPCLASAPGGPRQKSTRKNTHTERAEDHLLVLESSCPTSPPSLHRATWSRLPRLEDLGSSFEVWRSTGGRQCWAPQHSQLPLTAPGAAEARQSIMRTCSLQKSIPRDLLS